MERKRLGEILIEQGLITQNQLELAIAEQKLKKSRIGEILVDMGFVSESDIAAALGTQLMIPYYSSDQPEMLTPRDDQELERILPHDFAKQHIILPLSKNMNSLTCAIADPLDLMMLDNIKKFTGCEINPVIATRTDISRAIHDFYTLDKKTEGQNTLLGEAVRKTYSEDDGEQKEVQELGVDAELSLDKLIAKAEEAPVVKLVDLIIRQAIDERASDIHIEPFKDKIHVRYRIDGALFHIPPPARHLHLAIVSRVKILAKLDIAEKRLPQDGVISAKLENRTVDLRISTLPTTWGEKVVMRVIDRNKVKLELANLGFTQKKIEILKTALAKPYGLFFVTGPTGSGKSTTLYSALTETIDPKKNVVTVEDPVEFKFDGINQVHVKAEIGLTFAAALRSFLRQDPDIIMVGEVRDLETAQICVRAALTGHFVLSTLHTNDAASAITRLLDIGCPSYLLTPSLVVILAQRLSRRLCSKCKEAYEPTPALHGGRELNCDIAYKAVGCEECNHSGYKGRVVISEILVITDEIKELISKSASYNEINDAAVKSGMLSLFEDGLTKVEEGVTSFEEIVSSTAT